MTVLHTAVLINEVIDCLKISPRKIYVDGTIGCGGHSLCICDKCDHTNRVIGLDLDPTSCDIARKICSKYEHLISIYNISFVEIEKINHKVHGILLDLGLSSYQLSCSERGFSFMYDGPLDMRINQYNNKTTAKSIIMRLNEKQLSRSLKELADERYSVRIARIIKENINSLNTTKNLAQLIEKHIGWREKIHPATRTFQALRILVNDELYNLQNGLINCFKQLLPSGRLLVISFHRGEDRMVKHFILSKIRGANSGIFFSNSIEAVAYGKIRPTKSEIVRNPRARSAVLRWIEKK
jgi:16S rRNA (cytosine1402-N4)-methyltransferase